MATLRETKDHISSVRSTLKITSAMKLVASSKLRKAQRAIELLRPYETALGSIYDSLASGLCTDASDSRLCKNAVAVVAVASNSSLCGSFNANVIKKVLGVVTGAQDGTVVYSVGRKMAEAMKKAGYESPRELSNLIGHPSYAEAAGLADELCEAFVAGKYSRIVLVYNHFVNASKQISVVEQYLPFEAPASDSDAAASPEEYFILEPGRDEIARELLPKVLKLKLYAAILDSAAAEHAARTIAMQTASDNAQDLLGELTLEYNKARQQKITAELLDLASGIQK